MRHRSLAERWAFFESQVFPPGGKASPADIRAARLTYYAGVSTLNEIMTEEITRMPDDAAVEAVEAVQEELRQFARSEVLLGALLRSQPRGTH